MKITFGMRVMRAIFWLLFRVFARVDAQGLDTLPQDGPYIITINHLHLLDIPLLYGLYGKRYVLGLVGDTHRKNPFFRTITNIAHGIWINRGGADREALQTALNAIKGGAILGIAPEGTRSRVGSLLEGKPGVTFLVAQAKVPVYPLAHWGVEKFFSELRHFRRPQIFVRVGAPLDLQTIPILDRKQRIEVWTTEIMCHLAAMLPLSYRGFYADHPRLQELLREQGVRQTGLGDS